MTFPEFRNVNVWRPAHKHLGIRWVIQATGYDLSDISYAIFRSQSETGPFEQIATVEEGAYHYVDHDIDAGDARLFYYIIRAASKTGKGYRDSEVATLEHDADSIALTMIRQKMVFMERKSGVPIAVLQRKQWGAYCSRCWDKIRNMPRDPDCPDCFGTGFSGGYLKPAYAFALLNPTQSDIVRVGMPYMTDSTYLELANYPNLSVYDVIVDRVLNQRYKVDKVKFNTHRMAIVSQIAQVTKVDEHDQVYNIDVPQPTAAMLSQSWLGDAP